GLLPLEDQHIAGKAARALLPRFSEAELQVIPAEFVDPQLGFSVFNILEIDLLGAFRRVKGKHRCLLLLRTVSVPWYELVTRERDSDLGADPLALDGLLVLLG